MSLILPLKHLFSFITTLIPQTPIIFARHRAQYAHLNNVSSILSSIVLISHEVC